MELLTRTWFPDLNITKHWRSYILETQANWQIGSSIKDGKNLCKYWKASTFSRFYAFISSLLVTTTSRQLDWKGEVVLIIVGELFVVLEYNILTVYFCTKQSPFIRYTLSLQKQRVAGCPGYDAILIADQKLRTNNYSSFNSWVRASVPRVIAGTETMQMVTHSLVVDALRN